MVVNLSEMGINKLLGSGEIKYPVKVIVHSFSKRAKEKIEKVGGLILSP